MNKKDLPTRKKGSPGSKRKPQSKNTAQKGKSPGGQDQPQCLKSLGAKEACVVICYPPKGKPQPARQDIVPKEQKTVY